MKKNRLGEKFDKSNVCDQPMDCVEMVNKYGTYNIQPTCDTENSFPAIAQGYSKKGKKSIKVN